MLARWGDSSTASETHVECRSCGTNVTGSPTECPDCGGDIAVYELEK